MIPPTSLRPLCSPRLCALPIQPSQIAPSLPSMGGARPRLWGSLPVLASPTWPSPVSLLFAIRPGAPLALGLHVMGFGRRMGAQLSEGPGSAAIPPGWLVLSSQTCSPRPHWLRGPKFSGQDLPLIPWKPPLEGPHSEGCQCEPAVRIHSFYEERCEAAWPRWYVGPLWPWDPSPRP